MGFFRGVLEQRAVKQTYANSVQDGGPSWLGGGLSTTAGIDVDEGVALSYSTLYTCIRIISRTLAALPLHVNERLAKGRRRAQEHRLYRVVHDRPNQQMTSMTLRECLISHVLLRGNGYAWIEYDKGMNVRALWPLRPDMVRVEKQGDHLEYRARTAEGEAEERFEDWEILHVPGLGYDGVQGYNPITMLRESLGLAIAARTFGASWFGNGSRPGGFLETDKPLGETAYNRLKTDFEGRHQSPAKGNRIAILEDGLKWKQVSVPPEDAQFLQTQSFSRSDVAAWFGLPAWMVGEIEKQTSWGTGIESQDITLVKYTFAPMAVSIESEFNRKLFSPGQTDKFYIEHDFNGLLRSDFKTRMDGYRTGIATGIYTRNEVRSFENLNPLPPDQGGDVTLLPLNMVPADKMDELLTKPKPDPASAPADPSSKGDPADMPPARELQSRIERAMRHVLHDAGARVLSREAKRLRSLHGKAKGLADFHDAAAAFLEEHELYVLRTIEPLLEAMADAAGASIREQGAREFAKAHVHLALEQLREAITADRVAPALEDWEKRDLGEAFGSLIRATIGRAHHQEAA